MSGVSRRSRSCRYPAVERLEELLLLSTAPIVNLGASGNSGGGTVLVKDILPGTDTSVPNSLVDASGHLFFLAVSPTEPRMQLWTTDGSPEGTTNLTAGIEASTPLALGSSVVFTAFDVASRTFGIWTSDGTASGTHQVAALPRSSTTTGVSADGVVYFDIFNFVSMRSELWKSDGTASGTGLVAGIPDSSSFTVAGSKVFFQGSDSLKGSELWVSDGTAAGTHLVADIDPGADGSYPSNLTAVGGTLYFTAFDSFGSPNRLWKSDGTAAGTAEVAPSLQPVGLTELNGRLAFTAADSGEGHASLWTTDGTTSGTTLVANLPSGLLFPMTTAGGKAFFGLLADTDFMTKLWATDGTSAGTAPIAEIPDPSQLTASGNRIYFTGDDWGALGNELWSSDGTAAGTAPVADIKAGSGGSNPLDLLDVGGVLYFTADDGPHGRELWRSSPAVQQPSTTIDEGSTFVFSGSFTDPDNSPWTATVNYGDGSATQPLALGADHSFNLVHQYADNGSYLVTVTVTDAAGLSGSATTPVTVLNVAPSAAVLGLPTSSPEGTAIALTSLITDPSPVDTAAGFARHWTVTRGGATYAVGTGAAFSFTPDDNGTYLVTLTAADKDGAVTSTIAQVLNVTNAPPSVTLVGVPAGAEGAPVSFTASATDPSPVDVAAGLALSWSVTRNGVPFASGTGAGVSFTPGDDGAYVVTVSATDKDGGSSAAVATIIVANTAPTASITGAPATGTEGTAISLGSTASDPSPADNAAGFATSWAVTRDGSPFTSGTGASFSFVPTDNGTYVVTLTATDKDGGSSTATATIAVANVAPTATIAAPATGTEGTAVSLTSSVTDPGAADTAAGFTTSWTVTRNGSPFTTGSGSSFNFVPTDNGVYNVTLTATDKDGGSSTATASVVVANVAPTASITGAPASGTEGTAIALGSAVSDPGVADTAAGFAVTWSVAKDGSPFATGTGSSFNFVPTDNGTYVVSLTATDKDGGSSTASATIAVANVVPTASIAGDSSGVRGQTRQFTLSASDLSAADAAAGFTFRVNWGDGSPVQTIGGGQSAAVGHVYTQTGNYTVQVMATDKDGGVSAAATKLVTIEVVQVQTDPIDPTKTALVVGGTMGDDTIRFRPDGSTGRIQVRLNGSLLGSFAATGHIIAYGQAGNDDIKVSDSIDLPAILHGDGGDDTLQAAANAVLVGGSGKNTLKVGGGRNLLIGGTGADNLNGGSADNVIVTGSTAYDSDDSALLAILGEWQRGATLRNRVNNLIHGIAGGFKLDSSTVSNDRARDEVIEHGGNDWLLVASTDQVNGRECGSIISFIDRAGWDS